MDSPYEIQQVKIANLEMELEHLKNYIKKQVDHHSQESQLMLVEIRRLENVTFSQSREIQYLHDNLGKQEQDFERQRQDYDRQLENFERQQHDFLRYQEDLRHANSLLSKCETEIEKKDNEIVKLKRQYNEKDNISKSLIGAKQRLEEELQQQKRKIQSVEDKARNLESKYEKAISKNAENTILHGNVGDVVAKSKLLTKKITMVEEKLIYSNVPSDVQSLFNQIIHSKLEYEKALEDLERNPIQNNNYDMARQLEEMKRKLENSKSVGEAVTNCAICEHALTFPKCTTKSCGQKYHGECILRAAVLEQREGKYILNAAKINKEEGRVQCSFCTKMTVPLQFPAYDEENRQLFKCIGFEVRIDNKYNNSLNN